MEAPPPLPPALKKNSRGWLWLLIGLTVVLVLWAVLPKLFQMSGLTLTRSSEVWAADGTGTKTTVQIAGPGVERERLIAEGQTALDTGNVLARSLVPIFNQLGQECQTVDGLAGIRQNPATAQQQLKQWGEVQHLYEVVAKKWGEAVPLTPDTGGARQWLDLKARSLEHRAAYCGVFLEMVNVMLDPTLSTPADVIARLRPALERRVAGEAEAARLWAEADAVPGYTPPAAPVPPGK